MNRFQLMFALLLIGTSIQSQEFNILDFGAKSSRKVLQTKAIQSTIDHANEAGGGKVILPKGDYLSGSIVLHSDVELHLKKGATLWGSTNPDDYIKLNRWKALIMADQAKNIKISGKGTIDGQGEAVALHLDSLFYIGELDSSDYIFPEKRPSVKVRPQLIEMVDCQNVEVIDVKLKSAASWVQSYYKCSQLRLDNVTVDSDTYWNNDGIDIIDCQNVQITNCNINASDDGICIKSYGRPWHGSPFVDSLYIANCKVRSSASAVKFGTASHGGFRNVKVENIKVFDTFRSALALESYGNGFLENFEIDNIKAKNTGNALFIRIGKVNKDGKAGTLKNISITNMKVEVPFEIPDLDYRIRGPHPPYFHNVFPASITGLPEQAVENVTLENIQITYPGRANKAFANLPLSRLDDVPEQAEIYPEFSMFGELPAWAFYVRHVNGISFKNVKVKLKKSDYRPAFVFDDVKQLKLKEISIKGDSKKQQIFYHNTAKSEINSP
ncbi:MAG: glycosyl hydrolase family 28 protein [Vicingaceae bacterium]